MRTIERWALAAVVVASTATVGTRAMAGTFREGSFLREGEYLFPGQWLTDGCFYHTEMQTDGNLVTYAGPSNPANAIFTTDTVLGGLPPLHMPCSFTDSCSTVFIGSNSPPGAYAVMQTDGNFVVYSADNKALWWTGTQWIGRNAAHITQQDDGNLVIYSNFFAPSAYWSSEKVFPIRTAACGVPRSKKTVVSRDTWISAPATFTTIPTPDFWRCGSLCAAKSSCKAWQFVPVGWNDPNKAGCWLADSTGTGFMTGHPGFTAGIVVTCDQNNPTNCTTDGSGNPPIPR